MAEDGPGRQAAPVLSLDELVRARMQERGWSYTDLERASDRALTRGRWQQLGSGAPQRKFPDPESLAVIARVLEIDITTVVLAAARTLGLDVHRHGAGLAHLMPAGTERLSEATRIAILTLIRAAVTDTLPDDDADLDRSGGPAGLTLEWPKHAAPSTRAPDAPDAPEHG